MTSSSVTADTADTSTTKKPELDLSTAGIFKLMNNIGVEVKSVLLKTDGTVTEVDYDSTPKRNHAQELLDGLSPTIIGEYDEINVILVRGRIASPNSNLPLNEHKLRWPFAHLNGTIHGNIFCYRLTENAQHQSFTAKEYETFVAQPPLDPETQEELQAIHDENAKAVVVANNNQRRTTAAAETEEEEEEENNESNSTRFQLDGEFIRSVICNKIKADFPLKFGREPTEDELQNFYQATLQAFSKNFSSDAGIDDGVIQAAAEANGQEFLETVAEEEEDQDQEEYNEDEDDEDYNPAEDEAEEESDDDVVDDDPEFTKDFVEAIAKIQELPTVDRRKILEQARLMYVSETGGEPTKHQLADAFDLFKVDLESDIITTTVADVAVPLSEEEIRAELDVCMKHVRQLGRRDGLHLGQRICDTFVETNGRQPSDTELNQIFNRIKKNLNSEAKEEENIEHLLVINNKKEENEKPPAPLLNQNKNQNNYKKRMAVVRTVKNGERKISYLQSAFADIASQADSLPTVLLGAAQRVVLERLQSLGHSNFISQHGGRSPTIDELRKEVLDLSSEMFGNLKSTSLDLVSDDLHRSPHSSSLSSSSSLSTAEDDEEDMKNEQQQQSSATTTAATVDETSTTTTATVVKRVKVFNTPVKNTKNSARVDIYFEDPDTDQNILNAQQQFAKMDLRSDRQPSVDNISRLNEFLKISGALQETEMNVKFEEIVKRSLNLNVNSAADDEKESSATASASTASASAATATAKKLRKVRTVRKVKKVMKRVVGGNTVTA